MVKRTLVAGAIVCLTALAVSSDSGFAQAGAASTPTPTAAPNDYSKGEAWLCRPGRQDACAVDLSTTIVSATGDLKPEAWTANAKAPVDCFYVYPTVSTDPTDNSDMTADPAEKNVVRTQFARFASQCLPYAPLYRQITLAGLRKAFGGGGSARAGGIAYEDVASAWRQYVAHDNKGRGFVLIGHSQGSGMLQELIRQEIDGKPIQKQMLSAMLLGSTVAVPKGRDVGGAFQHVPLCHSATDLGCLITFASYRSTVPPPANALFGRVPGEGMAAACTNPAALGGGSGELHAYLTADGTQIVGRAMPKPWVTPEKTVSTPWVSVPGLLSARCTSNEHASGYLEVTVRGDPADARVDDITGDLGAGAQIQANWGLHLIDVDLAIGNLVDIVGHQARAYVSKQR